MCVCLEQWIRISLNRLTIKSSICFPFFFPSSNSTSLLQSTASFPRFDCHSSETPALHTLRVHSDFFFVLVIFLPFPSASTISTTCWLCSWGILLCTPIPHQIVILVNVRDVEIAELFFLIVSLSDCSAWDAFAYVLLYAWQID